MSWRVRRRRKLRIVQFLLIAAGAGFALLLQRIPQLIDPSQLASAPDQLADRLGMWSFLLAVWGVRDLATAYPQTFVALSGALVFGLAFAGFLAKPLTDRFLAAFNDDLLKPIAGRQTGEQDPSAFVFLEWKLDEAPRDRLMAWRNLEGWVRKDAGTSGGSGTLLKPLSVAALVGRPGSGKSRMAGEFARWLALGGGASRTRRQVLRRIGVYLRATLPFLRPRSNDPWDVGILEDPSGLLNVEQYAMELKGWSPRRPTLLLLDNANAAEEVAIRNALVSGSAAFRRPVRLLVVNQTITSGSLYRFEQGSWFYGADQADPPPIVLPDTAWFTDREARRHAFASPMLKGKSPEVLADVRANLFRITRGNPLLLELAIEWVGNDRGPLRLVSANELRGERAARIVRAFNEAGVNTPTQLAQISLATLIGGGRRDVIKREIAREFSGSDDLPLRSQIQHCFPYDPLAGVAGSDMIPPIRPELIGEAFVERVLQEIS